MRTMRKKILKFLGIIMMGFILTTSCEEYLNKAPEINVTDDYVLGKFLTFQGFIEDLYQGVTDPTLGNSS